MEIAEGGPNSQRAPEFVRPISWTVGPRLRGSKPHTPTMTVERGRLAGPNPGDLDANAVAADTLHLFLQGIYRHLSFEGSDAYRHALLTRRCRFTSRSSFQ